MAILHAICKSDKGRYTVRAYLNGQSVNVGGRAYRNADAAQSAARALGISIELTGTEKEIAEYMKIFE